MAYSNNVMIIRHELLSKLVRLWYDGALVEKIDSVPIEMIPRDRKERIRCCRHKERAVQMCIRDSGGRPISDMG